MMATDAMDSTGHCLCGAVSFVARDVVSGLGACHCDMCRRWSGAVFAAVSVSEYRITWEGHAHIRIFESSGWAERAWCDVCGSSLWFRVTAEGPNHGDYEVPLGLFDEQPPAPMEREIFADQAVIAIAGDHQRLTREETFALYGQTVQGA